MSLLHRRVNDDAEQRIEALASAQEQRKRVDETGGRLVLLTDSLRKQNETNHFVQRLQAAYGKGYTDGAASAGT